MRKEPRVEDVIEELAGILRKDPLNTARRRA